MSVGRARGDHHRCTWSAWTVLLTLLLTSLTALAQDAPAGTPSPSANSEQVSRRASSIARQTMSPFCPGRTLADCPSQYAAQWRDDIRRMVAEGKSADEIQELLSKRAGEDLSGIPARETSYTVPALFAAIAIAVLAFVLMRLRRTAAEQRATAQSTGVEGAGSTAGAKGAGWKEQVDDARLEQELRAEDDDD